MKTVTLEELGRQVAAYPSDRPRVVVSGNHAVPFAALGVIDESLPSYVLHVLNAPPGIPDRDGVTLETAFVGVGMRKSPRLSYVPCRLSMVPLLFSRTLPPDIVVLHCAPPRDGVLSLGVEVNILPAAIEAARSRSGLVVAVVNPQMPYTFGDAQIQLSDIDLLVEVDEPLPTAAAPVLDDDSRTIGLRISRLVPDGATLQMGIGAVPDAALAGLMQHRGLRVWTEMFSDGVLALDRAGAMDPDHPLTTSFSFGSADLYAWLDGNPRVRFARTERTNAPGLIAQQQQMTSINAAIEVDLFGQANASRIAHRIFSGFGGQTDFIVGALHSPGGQSFIALRSWHPKADVSTVIPLLSSPVTSFQQSAFVSEHGMARLWGRSQRDQAHDIIANVAHPRAREALLERATQLGLA